MPRYLYRCDKCVMEFDVFHSIRIKHEVCTEVNPEGDRTGKLTRIPSFSSALKYVRGDSEKTGKLTDEFIERAQSELQTQKEKLKNREHE